MVAPTHGHQQAPQEVSARLSQAVFAALRYGALDKQASVSELGEPGRQRRPWHTQPGLELDEPGDVVQNRLAHHQPGPRITDDIGRAQDGINAARDGRS